MLIQERKLLKRILVVKKGTPTDLIYIELKRPDIISKIKDSKVNQNICTTPEDAAKSLMHSVCVNIFLFTNIEPFSCRQSKS